MREEEKRQMLEKKIQQALSQGVRDLDEATDVRKVRNIKLAKQLLKIKRKKKEERDQKIQQENIEAQSKANQETQQAAAQAEIQKNQAKAQIDMKLEQQKNQLKMEYLEKEDAVKKELMNHEMFINMKLSGIESRTLAARDKVKEDRLDSREDKKAEHQRSIKQGESLKKFESSGNDVIGGGLGLESFDPR